MACVLLTCPAWQPETRAWTTIIALDTYAPFFAGTVTVSKERYIIWQIGVRDAEAWKTLWSESLNTGGTMRMTRALTMCIIRSIEQKMRNDLNVTGKLDLDELEKQLLKM